MSEGDGQAQAVESGGVGSAVQQAAWQSGGCYNIESDTEVWRAHECVSVCVCCGGACRSNLEEYEKYKKITEELVKQTGSLKWTKGH